MTLSTRLQGLDAEKFLEEDLGSPMEDLLAFPKYIDIETVNTCNARCVMCEIDFSKPKAFMSDALFDKILAELAEDKDRVEKVHLYKDNEPLIDNRLSGHIRRLKEIGIKCVNISTNGSLLDKKGQELLESGLDEIYINVDSLKKEVYENIRVGLNFEQVYNSTVDFIRLRDQINPGLLIRLQMIVQEENHTEVTDWIKHWEEKLSPNDQVVAAKAHNWGSQIDVMDFNDDYDPNDFPCMSLWGTLTIHQSGRGSLCGVDTHLKIPIGDIQTHSMVDIWQNSKALNRVREMHLKGQREKINICNGCSVWRKTENESVKHVAKKTIGS